MNFACKINDDDCSAPGGSIKRGWCDVHYMRWYRHGNPRAVIAYQRGAAHHNWLSSDDLGYSGAHVRDWKASDLQCVFFYMGDCSGRMNKCWNNITPMSEPGSASFFPACQSHHQRFDSGIAFRNPDHGTHQMYERYHCRCDDCRKWQAGKSRQQRSAPLPR